MYGIVLLILVIHVFFFNFIIISPAVFLHPLFYTGKGGASNEGLIFFPHLLTHALI